MCRDNINSICVTLAHPDSALLDEVYKNHFLEVIWKTDAQSGYVDDTEAVWGFGYGTLSETVTEEQ